MIGPVCSDVVHYFPREAVEGTPCLCGKSRVPKGEGYPPKVVDPVLEAMVPQLALHEGVRLKVYKDTRGYDTLGIGYNVTSRGVDSFQRVIGRKLDLAAVPCCTRPEAFAVLRVDVDRVQKAVLLHFPEYVGLSDVRQRVVLDMAFNMGLKALGFHQTILAVRAGDWSRAAREMYKSDWAMQVGDGPGGKRDRCDRLVQMVLTNKAPDDIPAIAA